jgi:hypothetical protein
MRRRGLHLLNEYYEYTTIQGDTFDMISLDFYDDEKYASEIIKSNPEYRTVLVFDEGSILKIPIIDEETAESLPPWKR